MPGLLWITYAWADNDEGDFDFLVQELAKAGVVAVYDKVALVPGRRLWPQVASQISSERLSGWAVLITPNSLASKPCQEELSYALQRALETRGDEFPLVGFLHNVSIRDVPLALRVRLCVNLAGPNWVEETRAAVAGVPPPRVAQVKPPIVLGVHQAYRGRPGKIAIEIRPRFGELRYWRWAFPSLGPQPAEWGTWPANGAGGISSVMSEVIEGEYSDIGGTPMKFVGAGSAIGQATSAYAVFDQEIPAQCFFGVAQEPFGLNAKGMIYQING